MSAPLAVKFVRARWGTEHMLLSIWSATFVRVAIDSLAHADSPDFDTAEKAADGMVANWVARNEAIASQTRIVTPDSLVKP